MATKTDGTTENASVTTEVNIAGNADVSVPSDSAIDQNATDEGTDAVDNPSIEDSDLEDTTKHTEPVRTEEVHALLGGGNISDREEPEIVPDQDAEGDAVASADVVNAEDEADKAVSATDTLSDLPDNRLDYAAEEQPVARVELKDILESLQDSLDKTQYISSKIGAISNDTDRLTKQVNGISINCELLTAEMESITSNTNTKNVLSKTFLTTSLAVLALLVIFQIYMFISLINTQRLQHATGSSVLQNISGLNKKMAAYDKTLTKALENQAQKEHAQPNPVATEMTGHENKGVASANVTPVLEKLNKLRNGLPEKKLIRKETGDWFVYNNKKSEESISDVDVIEVLNQAYRRIGRTLSPTVPTPPHNALCILKPDGKGGTEVLMTKDFLP